MKRLISILIKAALSLVILGWFIRTFNITAAVFDLSQFQWQWSWVPLVCGVIQVTVQAVRWRVLYGGGAVPRLQEFIRFTLIGYFFGTLLPWSLGGDAVKAVAFGKRHNGMLNSSMAVLFGRIFGITALLFLFWGSYVVVDYPVAKPVLLVMALLTLAATGGLILVFKSSGVIVKLVPKTSRIHRVLNYLQTVPTSRWIQGALLSVVNQLAMFLLIYSSLKLVGAAVTLPMIFLYAPLTTLLLFLPVSFSGLGIREASLTYFLAPFQGVTSELVVQASMVNYVVLLLLALTGGALFLLLGSAAKNGSLVRCRFSGSDQ